MKADLNAITAFVAVAETQSFRAAGDRLGVTRSTWNKWRGRGDTPRVVKLPNGSLRIRECDLAAWVEGRFA